MHRPGLIGNTHRDDLCCRNHDIVLAQRVQGLLRVVDDQPENPKIGRVGDGKRANINLRVSEDLCDLRKLPLAVLTKYGNLSDSHMHAPFLSGHIPAQRKRPAVQIKQLRLDRGHQRRVPLFLAAAKCP